MYAANKKGNEYAEAIDRDVYEKMPKAVIAAVAVSFATCGGDHIEEATNAMLVEWWTLYQAGIVPQKPPFMCPPEDD